MTPFANPSNPPEEHYNRSHMKTRVRVVVEQCFGILKSCIRCVHRSGENLQYTPQKCAKRTMTCLLLHNYCTKRRIPPPDEMVKEDIVNINIRELPAGREQGRGHREEIVNLSFG